MNARGMLVLALLSACAGDDTKTDTDTDTDTDADADTDADTDTDTDADTDTDVPAVDDDEDGFSADVDCDDADPDVYPGAPDLCGDDRVTDCDRTSDDGLVTLDGTTGFDDLQDALDAAGAGSEIVVCPGLHVGPFVATNAVRLVSLSDDAADTILSGDDAGTTLELPDGSEVVALTVRDGRSFDTGGGIRLSTAGGTLLVERCDVTANQASQGAGVAVPPDGVVTLVDTAVHGNTALEGGGGAHVSPGGRLELTGTSEIHTNQADEYGAGVALFDGTLAGGAVRDNVLNGYAYFGFYYGTVYGVPPSGGGGVAATGDSTIESAVVRDNSAYYGAGVSVMLGSLTLIGTSVVANTQSSFGGGAFVLGGALTLDDASEIAANDGYYGGGVGLAGGTLTGGTVLDNVGYSGGGAVALVSTISDTTFVGNQASYGGGLWVLGDVVVEGATFDGNTAAQGGAIATREGYYDYYGVNRAQFVGCTLTGNTADQGGGLYAGNESPFELIDTIVVDNEAISGGGAFMLDGALTSTGGAYLRNTALGASGSGGVHVGQAGAFRAIGTDFGVDADDNVPGDVATDTVPAVSGYGAAATFDCTVDGCTPAP